MKVIISGSRSFDNYDLLKTKCEQILVFYQGSGKSGNQVEEIEIISGMARGADLLGARFGFEKGWTVTQMPADWEKFGKRAGFKRNVEMIQYAQEVNLVGHHWQVIIRHQPILIIFWDGKSPGTKNMIDSAKKRGIYTHLILY